MSCLVNPKTKRAVKKGSKLYKQLENDPPLDRRCKVNPKTKRAVRSGTRVYKQLPHSLSPDARRSTSLSFSSPSPKPFVRLRRRSRSPIRSSLSFSSSSPKPFVRLRRRSNSPKVLPRNWSNVLPRSNSPKVLPRSNSPKVLSWRSKSRSPKVLPRSRSPKVLPRSRSPKVSNSPSSESRSKSPCRPSGYKPGQVTRVGKTEIRNSYIPNAGLGLFAVDRIPRLSVITEYGGKVLDRKEAIALRKAGLDTHVRAIAKGYESLDGRVQPGFSKEYYASNDLAGSFANQASSPKDQNAKFVRKDQGKKHPSGEWASGRILLKATKDIEPGCEILVNYGKTFKKLHL